MSSTLYLSGKQLVCHWLYWSWACKDLIFSCCFFFLKQEHHMHQSHPCHGSPYECRYAQWRRHQCPWTQKHCIICCMQRRTPLSKQCSSLLMPFPLPSLFQACLARNLLFFNTIYCRSRLGWPHNFAKKPINNIDGFQCLLDWAKII